MTDGRREPADTERVNEPDWDQIWENVSKHRVRGRVLTIRQSSTKAFLEPLINVERAKELFIADLRNAIASHLNKEKTRQKKTLDEIRKLASDAL